jgi:hypothetical protein
VGEEGEPAQDDPGPEQAAGDRQQRQLGERRAHERQVDEVERRGKGRGHAPTA